MSALWNWQQSLTGELMPSWQAAADLLPPHNMF
jgi:hypothetical protein